MENQKRVLLHTKPGVYDRVKKAISVIDAYSIAAKEDYKEFATETGTPEMDAEILLKLVNSQESYFESVINGVVKKKEKPLHKYYLEYYWGLARVFMAKRAIEGIESNLITLLDLGIHRHELPFFNVTQKYIESLKDDANTYTSDPIIIELLEKGIKAEEAVNELFAHVSEHLPWYRNIQYFNGLFSRNEDGAVTLIRNVIPYTSDKPKGW